MLTKTPIVLSVPLLGRTLYTAIWRIWAALNLHNNLVCLSHLENIVYRWVIGVPFQTV